MCVNMARHLVPRLTKGMGCGDHDHAHSFLFRERGWLIVGKARYPVPLLTKGIGGGAHGHIPPSTSTHKEGWVVSSLHTPSSSGKGIVVTMAQTSCSPSGKGKVVVAVIMVIYTHFSSTIRKDWWSYPYTFLPLLGRGVVLPMAQTPCSTSDKGDGVVVVIMARYTSSSTKGKDWCS